MIATANVHDRLAILRKREIGQLLAVVLDRAAAQVELRPANSDHGVAGNATTARRQAYDGK